MNRILPTLAAAFLFALPAAAQLSEGADAPSFTAPATLGGKEFLFSLSDALKTGPVVLYFYPAAFTKGCTIEAHDFAEATDKFKSLGATVIGVSADGVAKLNDFSVSECRSKFAVASDADQKIMKSYDAVLEKKPELSNRTSYVISPEGKIIFAYTALDPEGHVEKTMAAVEAWKAAH
ncbi:Putative peroxiredoxin [Alphaproteobacteria bacterium SO-S41]|nr:Putative peroxiredoxin [Alphaproteobacteria bacterium SO-S41]